MNLADLRIIRKPITIHKIIFIAILINFVAFTTTYSLYTPSFEGGDESFHYIYSKRMNEGKVTDDFYLKIGPLYYSINSIFFNFVESPDDYYGGLKKNANEWPVYQNRFYHSIEEAYPFSDIALTVHTLRIFSIFCGIITIIFVYKIAKLIFPNDRWFPLFTMTFVSLIPKFTFQNSTITNDTLVWSLTTISIYYIFKFVNNVNERKCLILFSIFLGLAMLTKANAIVLYLVVLTTFVYLLYSKQINVKSFFKNSFLVAIISTISGTWYTFHKIILKFNPENFHFNHIFRLLTEAQTADTVPDIQLARIEFLSNYSHMSQRLFEMNFSWLGWHVLRAPHEIIVVAGILTIIAIAGLFLVFARGSLTNLKISKNQIVVLFSSTGFMLSAVIFYVSSGSGGIRYAYPVIAVLGVLFALGLYAFVGKKNLRILLIIPIIFLIILNVSLLIEIDKQWYHGINFYENPYVILLDVYNSRADLQKTFPEVKEGKFDEFLVWVKVHGLTEHPHLRKIEPLIDLIQTFYLRNDLQEKFPEVINDRNIKNLVKWGFEEGSHETQNLVKHTDYFVKYYQNIS